MSHHLILYHTSGCHLCELAEQVLASVKEQVDFTWEKVDIADDDRLVEQYGVSIPVVKLKSNGCELGWPFDETSLFGLLTQSTPTH